MEKLDKRYLSQNFRTKFIGSEEVRVTQKSEIVYVVHLILLCVVGKAYYFNSIRVKQSTQNTSKYISYQSSIPGRSRVIPQKNLQIRQLPYFRFDLSIFFKACTRASHCVIEIISIKRFCLFHWTLESSHTSA